jgi:hypothetical protein
MLAALLVSALWLQTPIFESRPLQPPVAPPEFTVYVFTTTDCPISSRYAPEVKRLAAKFKGKAAFVLVYPVPSDTPAMIAAHYQKFSYGIQSVRDVDQRLMKLTGATIAPEVALMKGSELLYRGRIDDRYADLGTDRQVPTRRDLELALSAAIAGRPIAVTQTQAVGCILADLVK